MSVYFVSHPEVIIDKNIPIPQWELSEIGKKKVQKLSQQVWINTCKCIYTSNEQKAKTTAEIINRKRDLPIQIIHELGEINRSSTGYLEQNIFMEGVNALFSFPNESYNGWEKAIDGQKRIITTIKLIISVAPQGSIIISSHGAVGALLFSFLMKRSITKKDLPLGLGYYFIFHRETLQIVQPWKPIDD